MRNITTKVIVFDFNDTLSPSNFIQTFERYESLLGMPAAELAKAYIDNGLLQDLMTGKLSSEAEFWQSVSQVAGVDLDLLTAMAKDIALSKHLDTRVMQLVDELRNKYQLALLTDNLLETFDFWVERFALQSKFDVIVNSADYGILKSSPEIYSILLQILHVGPQEVLLIDDNPYNLSVAESIGIRVLLFVGAQQLERSLIDQGLLDRPVLRTGG